MKNIFNTNDNTENIDSYTELYNKYNKALLYISCMEEVLLERNLITQDQLNHLKKNIQKAFSPTIQ